MGTVHALAVHESATVAEASDAYLATLAGPESTGTLRVYAGVLRAFAEGLGADTDVADLKPRALTRDDIAIRERTLWRMLYETAARSAEVLRLDVEDLDMPDRKPDPISSRGPSPAMTSRSASAPSGGCCTRPPPARLRC